MSTLPRHVRLTGGDYFIRAVDLRIRRTGLPGNICRMVLRLDGGPDAEGLRRRFAQAPALAWLSGVCMIRPVPFLPPIWRAAGKATDIFRVHDVASEGDLLKAIPASVLGRELRANHSPAVALDLIRYPSGAAHLVLAWHHALMDLRGAELLLRHLDKGEPVEMRDLVTATQRGFHLPQLLRGYLRKVVFARESLELINTACRDPLFSLLPAAPPPPTCRNEYRLVSLSEEETARVDAHCRRLNADFRRSHFYLAAAIQALHPLATKRGNEAGAYLIPVAHDLRRRGATGPIFSNQLSFLFYRIEPSLATNLGGMIGELTRQMMDQVRHRRPESFVAAMEMFKPMPLGIYASRLGRPTKGKFASLFFSDPGESFAGMRELFGARLTDVTHLAPTARPPGLTVVFSRYQGRLSFVLAWIEDCLSASEANDFESGLRAAMLGEQMQ